MFTGTVNFNIRKFENCPFFKKSSAQFQKVMFTGTVNFDFENSKNDHFLQNPSPIFKS